MKYVLPIGVVACVLGVWYFNPFQNTEVYEAPEVIEVEKTVEVETLSKRITDAQSASSTEIENAAQAAYEAKKEQLLKEVELKVRTDYENELKSKRIELEKEVGDY